MRHFVYQGGHRRPRQPAEEQQAGLDSPENKGGIKDFGELYLPERDAAAHGYDKRVDTQGKGHKKDFEKGHIVVCYLFKNRSLDFARDDKNRPGRTTSCHLRERSRQAKSRNLPDRARKDKEDGILWLERLPVDNRAPESQLIGILEVIPEPQAAGQ